MAERRYSLINPRPDPLVQNVQNSSYSFTASDIGKLVTKASGGAGETFTIPVSSTPDNPSFDSDAFDTDAFSSDAFLFSVAGGDVLFKIGTMIAIDNSGGGTLTIAINDNTLIWAKDNSTGPRILADGGLAVILKVNATTWKIVGEGLT